MKRLVDEVEEIDRHRFPDAEFYGAKGETRYVARAALDEVGGVEARFDQHEGAFGSFVLEPYAIVARGDRYIRVYAGVSLAEGKDKGPRQVGAFFDDFCTRGPHDQRGLVDAVVEAIRQRVG